MDITDEMRREIRREDCKLYGHKFNLNNLIGGTDVPNPNDPHGFPMPKLRARDASKLPHILCDNCGAVWIVVDEPGDDYEDAVDNLASRVKNVKPGSVSALTPYKVEGVDGEPITMPEGKTIDDLPETHPAAMFERSLREEEHVKAAAEESERLYNEFVAASEKAAVESESVKDQLD